MKLSFHQLRVFSQVIKQQGITAAAKKIHMTQPAVSNILRQLEDSCACSLVEVIGKKVYATDAGKVLLRLADKIELDLHECESELTAIKNVEAGTIKVAIVSTAKYFMPRLLAAFKREHGDINLELVVCNRQQIIERLNDNLDDFVIMSQPITNSAFKIEPFYEDKLVVAAAASKQLSTKSKIKLSQLKDEPWLLREAGSGTRMVMEKLFEQYQMQPNIAMESSNNESITQLIVADMGISIVSLHSIELELNNSLIKFLPVQKFPLRHKWFRVFNKNKHISPVVAAFNKFVQSHQNLAHYESWLAN